MMRALGGMNQEAEYLVLRGLLALEAGCNTRAKDYFQKAVAFWDSPAGATLGGRENGSPRSIARNCLEVLTAAGP